MSLVSSVLNGVRYDLRNYSDIDFDSELMIHYLNRAIKTLDYTLMAHNSDQTLNKGDTTLSTGGSTAAVPTGALNIREVWVEQDRKENLDIMDIYYRAQFRSTDSAEPNFWCHDGDYIRFEVAADQDYTITCFYDKASTVLTAETNDMPYDGKYDDALREAVVLLCQSKKYKNPTQADAAYARIFDNIVKHDVVNRTWKKKTYRLDF